MKDSKLSRQKKRVKYSDEIARYESPDRAPTVDRGVLCEVLRYDPVVRLQFEYSNDKFIKLDDGFEKEYEAAPGPGMSLTAILRLYKLQVKEKIALGYSIAFAFWQFYDTEILRDKWTSDRILFMPSPTGFIPNQPCVSAKCNPSYVAPDERLSLLHLGHRYPRLLALAIILIEIGIGEPLQLQSLCTPVSQINADWQAGMKALKLLKSMDWYGFGNKHTYVEAIENCLQSRDYDIDPVAGAQPAEGKIAQRRNIIYNKVVWPLQRLLEIGYQTYTDEITYFKVKSTQCPDFTSQSLDTRAAGADLPLAKLFSTPVFHGKVPNPKAWLEDLVAINTYVHRLRLKHGITRNIKVAILDTGCHLSAAIFKKKPRLATNIMGWKDYVSESEEKIDTHGHGTFMTGLLLESAPLAELHVARVASGMDDLANNVSKIAEVCQSCT